MLALENRHHPTVIALSRQGCANLHGSDLEKVRSGAYVLSSPANGASPKLVLVGTGSEVQLLVTALAGLEDVPTQARSLLSSVAALVGGGSVPRAAYSWLLPLPRLQRRVQNLADACPGQTSESASLC